MIMYIGLDSKIRASAGALALTLLLAGCATGPAYVRPSVDVPQSFKEQPAGAAAAVQQTRAMVGQARAAYFPTIQAGIEPNRSRTSQTVVGRQGLAGQTVWDNTA